MCFFAIQSYILLQIKLHESLVAALPLQPAGHDLEVAWVDGCVTFPTDSIDENLDEENRQGKREQWVIYISVRKR